MATYPSHQNYYRHICCICSDDDIDEDIILDDDENNHIPDFGNHIIPDFGNNTSVSVNGPTLSVNGPTLSDDCVFRPSHNDYTEYDTTISTRLVDTSSILINQDAPTDQDTPTDQDAPTDQDIVDFIRRIRNQTEQQQSKPKRRNPFRNSRRSLVRPYSPNIITNKNNKRKRTTTKGKKTRF